MQTNPLLMNLRLPGETIRLPSRALLYTTADVAQSVIDSGGEIHVFPLTTYEEILLKTPDLLFSGHAIVQTFARCIPDVLNPMTLLAKDVEFILVALRKVTYGNAIELRYKHSCDNSHEHPYIIDTQQFMTLSTELNARDDMWDITLPNAQKVYVRPYLFKDVVAASQQATNQPNYAEQTDLEFAELLRKTIVDGLAPAIVRVDDVDDVEMIKEWIDNLPTVWVKDITSRVEKISRFGVTFETTVACKDCNEDILVSVPLDPQSFFTQPSKKETVS